MNNLKANFEDILDEISQAYTTQQSARSRIHQAHDLSCAFPKLWKAITDKMDSTLDDITSLIRKLEAHQKFALSPTNTNQSLKELSK